MACDVSPQNATLPALPSPSQDKALAALLSGETVTASAKAAGVDRATLNRWLSDDPIFIAAYNSYRIEMVDTVRSNLRLLAAESVKTIRGIMADKDAPASVRLKAATDVLAMALGDDLSEKMVDPKHVEATLKREAMFSGIGKAPKRLT